MRLVPAPLHAELAQGPADSQAWWVTTDDGLRLRVALFPVDPKADKVRGTVLLFPGRTEYIEKYGRTSADLSERGYNVLVIDWRGQGLADRMLNEPMAGHVHVFEDYQHDVAALLTVVEDLDLPRPLHLIGHSMGGCIGLRAVLSGLPVETCVFTGPMWGIRMADPLRPAAWALSWWGRRFGLGHVFTPGTKAESYVVTEPFAGNLLTCDKDMWDYMRDQVLAVPELQLGGPSLNWLHEALAETRELSKLPAPSLPCLTFVGTNERIVSTNRIAKKMAEWPGGKLVYVDGGEHEILMEDRQSRTRVADQICAHFEDPSTKSALTA